MALTAIGIIEIASNVDNFQTQAINYFERAFQANPRNPLCINYLAEHYFMRKEYELTVQLCEAGIQLLKQKT